MDACPVRVLVVDDVPVQRIALQRRLDKWGYEVLAVESAEQAYASLGDRDAPTLVVLDWTLPDMDGPELCRRIRAHASLRTAYLILYTSRESSEDLVAGLEAGANDFVSKTADPEELRARLQVGARYALLHRDLQARTREVEAALETVNKLQGILPICSYCKRVRDDRSYWHEIDRFLVQRTDLELSWSTCDQCAGATGHAEDPPTQQSQHSSGDSPLA